MDKVARTPDQVSFKDKFLLEAAALEMKKDYLVALNDYIKILDQKVNSPIIGAEEVTAKHKVEFFETMIKIERVTLEIEQKTYLLAEMRMRVGEQEEINAAEVEEAKKNIDDMLKKIVELQKGSLPEANKKILSALQGEYNKRRNIFNNEPLALAQFYVKLKKQIEIADNIMAKLIV